MEKLGAQSIQSQIFVFKKRGNILMRLFSRKFLVFGLTLEYSISCFGNKYCRLDVPIHDGVFELSEINNEISKIFHKKKLKNYFWYEVKELCVKI